MKNKGMLILAISLLILAIIFYIAGNSGVGMELLIVSMIINFVRGMIEIWKKRKQ